MKDRRTITKTLKIFQDPIKFSDLSNNALFSFNTQAENLYIKISKSRAMKIGDAERLAVEPDKEVYGVYL